ncbi:MAG: prepilin peptidase [Spirochaetes bacterium]|nr:prepilin peptidase [Spirochaetota bacterium]
MKLFIFFFGTLFGSFFHTLSIRFINGSFRENKYEALFSRSKCPACGTSINPLYLIPIIGYIILKGRCGNCKNRISVLYPVLEIFYGFLLLLITSKNGINPYAFCIFITAGIGIVISQIDLKTFLIPNSLLLIFLIFSIYPIIINHSYLDNLYGMLFMALFFIIILLIFPGSFGGGDVKFAAVIGVLLGLELSVLALETALVTGSIAGIIYAVKTGRGLKSKIPFAPFLTFGLLVSIIYGREIVLVYYRILF